VQFVCTAAVAVVQLAVLTALWLVSTFQSDRLPAPLYGTHLN